MATSAPAVLPVLLQLPSSAALTMLLILIAPFIYTAYQISHTQPQLFLILTTYCAAINVLTFISYVHDKRRSRIAGWRVKETTLQLFALLGGWPAAFLAMRMLRHKIRKTNFQVVFWGTVWLWFGAWWKLWT